MRLTLSLDEFPILNIDFPFETRLCLSDCIFYLYAHDALLHDNLLSHSRLISHLSRLKKGLNSSFTTLYRIKNTYSQCKEGSPGPGSLEKLFYLEGRGKGLVALYNLPGDRARNLNSIQSLALDEQMLLARAVNIITPETSVAKFISKLESPNIKGPGKRKRVDSPDSSVILSSIPSPKYLLATSPARNVKGQGPLQRIPAGHNDSVNPVLVLESGGSLGLRSTATGSRSDSVSLGGLVSGIGTGNPSGADISLLDEPGPTRDNGRLDIWAAPLNVQPLLDVEKQQDGTAAVDVRGRNSETYTARCGPFDQTRVSWTASEHSPEFSVPMPIITRIKPPLSRDGLIKFRQLSGNRIEDIVKRFYVDSICSGRTILHGNVYRAEVLQVATEDKATRCAAMALSASYYKEYLEDGSPERRRAEQLEIEGVKRAFGNLGQTGISKDAALMLLIHHAIINPRSHRNHWTKYLYQLRHSPGQQTNVVIAAHSIWLMAFMPLDDKYDFQKYDYHWLGYGDSSDLHKVNSILGLSRKMLYFQYLIRMQAKANNRQGNLLTEIEEYVEVLDDQDLQRPWVNAIATGTLRSYRLATMLYAYARLYRFLPSDPVVKKTVEELVEELAQLPTSGRGYSGIHPAFCFLIACACTEEVGSFKKMYGIFVDIGSVNKSNVLDLLGFMRWMWTWKSTRVLDVNWWEELTTHLDTMMDGKPMCVT